MSFQYRATSVAYIGLAKERLAARKIWFSCKSWSQQFSNLQSWNQLFLKLFWCQIRSSLQNIMVQLRKWSNPLRLDKGSPYLDKLLKYQKKIKRGCKALKTKITFQNLRLAPYFETKCQSQSWDLTKKRINIKV